MRKANEITQYRFFSQLLNTGLDQFKFLLPIDNAHVIPVQEGYADFSLFNMTERAIKLQKYPVVITKPNGVDEEELLKAYRKFGRLDYRTTEARLNFAKQLMLMEDTSYLLPFLNETMYINIDESLSSKTSDVRPNIVAISTLLGQTYQQLSRTEEALTQFENALAYSEDIALEDYLSLPHVKEKDKDRIIPRAHPICRKALTDLGFAYLYAGQHHEAIEIFKQFQMFHLSTQSNKNSWDFSYSWMTIASLLGGNQGKAKNYQITSLEQTENMLRHSFPTKTPQKHLSYAIDCHNFGLLLSLSGNHAKAKTHIQGSQAILIGSYGFNYEHKLFEIMESNIQKLTDKAQATNEESSIQILS